jgi:uncharacterized protein (DUF2249 family)
MNPNQTNTGIHNGVFESFCDPCNGEEVGLISDEEPDSTG